MPDELVAIAVAEHEAQGALFKDILKNAGIEAVVSSDNALGFVFGIAVMVNREDEERAKEILKTAGTRQDEASLSSAAGVTVKCGKCKKLVTFDARKKGTVQSCPHCFEYLDVPEE